MATDEKLEALPQSTISEESSTMTKTPSRNSTSSESKPCPSPSPPPSQPPPPPSPPPNGGLAAWLHVLSSFLLYFNTWGLLVSFGVYQTFYKSQANTVFTASHSAISWIGSLEAFILLLTGTLAGPLFDKGYLRTLLITGSCLVVLGHFMLSLSKTYWEVVLSQGVTIGVGTGLLFVPCVATLPQYWSSRLGMAVGIASSGASLGGVVYPVVMYRLVKQVGFVWAVRTQGLIVLGTLTVPVVLMRLRVQPRKARALVDLSGFRDMAWVSFVLIGLVGFAGLYVFFFYASYYGLERKITGTSLSFYLVPILNGASTFGRILPNALSDVVGPFNILAPGCLLLGIFSLCFLAAKSAASLVLLASLAGFMGGIVIGIPPLCFVAITEDKSRLGTRIGMGYAVLGVGILMGGPVGGIILGHHEPLNWVGLWCFGGACACASGIALYGLRVKLHGCKLIVKA